MARRASEPDVVALAAAWGALWGVALGFWALAPEIVDTHRIRLDTPGEWAILILAFAAIFGALGAFLSVVAGVALVAIAGFLPRRPQRETAGR